MDGGIYLKPVDDAVMRNSSQYCPQTEVHCKETDRGRISNNRQTSRRKKEKRGKEKVRRGSLMQMVRRSTRYASFLQSASWSWRCFLSLILTLSRWGLMCSVLTEPSTSFTPYSTSDSSPALNIIQTWGRMEEGSVREGLETTHIFVFEVKLFIPS